jgi:hypothetical protein
MVKKWSFRGETSFYMACISIKWDIHFTKPPPTYSAVGYAGVSEDY